MDAVKLMGEVVRETAELTKDNMCMGDAKLVVFCNAPEDNPFMAGAFHGAAPSSIAMGVTLMRLLTSGMPYSALMPSTTEDQIARQTGDLVVDFLARLVRVRSMQSSRLMPIVTVRTSRFSAVSISMVSIMSRLLMILMWQPP